MGLAYQEYYTLNDYQQWEGAWELIDGMPYAMAPSPTVTHQTVSLNVAAMIKEQLGDKHNCCNHCIILMETDWQVSNDTVVRPDVMMVCQKVGESVTVTPELIIEVVSPSSAKRDEVMKFDLYHRAGVLYYLLVYPDTHSVIIYINKQSGFRQLASCCNSTAEFVIDTCRFSVDFSLIWR